MAAGRALQVVDLGLEGLVQVLLPAREQCHQAPRIGRHDTSAAAFQQGQTRVCFQPGDGAADGRRIGIQLVGRRAQRAGLDDLQQTQRPLELQDIIHQGFLAAVLLRVESLQKPHR
ncbi:hypothetical protein D3C71_1309810 [compost metagenome]